MTEEDISNALGQRLKDLMLDCPVIFENRDGIPIRPYAAAEIVRTTTTDDTLAGGWKIARGFLQVTVVTEAGIFANQALQIADQIAAAFLYGTRIAIPDGTILITAPPAVQQGFRDGPDWRLPVRIDYEAEEAN